jgi:O-antigen/teichoic acid export membrane protein
MRTLARLPIQITNVFNSSVWPEMSRAFGSGDMPMLRQLHRQTWGVTLFLTVGSGLGLCLLGPVVAHIWLGANVAYNAPLLNTLIAVTVVSATWNASSVVLAAINAHARMGLVYVLTNAATLGTAYLLTPHLGWSALLSCLLVAEVMLMAYVLPLVLATTADKLRPFVSFALVGGIRRLIPSRNFK